MNVFFDNCTSPVLTATLDGFLRHGGGRAAHIRDLPCGPHARDVEWIDFLRSDGAEWMVITGDGRISKNAAERAAFRSAGLRGFVLAPAYQKTPTHQVASFLLWRWPDVEQLMSLVSGAALFELPMHKSSKIRQLPL